MILYHGSDCEICQVELEKCRPFKDFGRGFYLTTNKSHAASMAKRAAQRNGTTPIITAFEFDTDALKLNKHLKVLKFRSTSREWAEFVYNNRENRYYSHNYDIVVGPIADDGMAELLAYAKRGVISLSELAARLKYSKPTEQYCFLTERGLEFLKKL